MGRDDAAGPEEWTMNFAVVIRATGEPRRDAFHDPLVLDSIEDAREWRDRAARSDGLDPSAYEIRGVLGEKPTVFVVTWEKRTGSRGVFGVYGTREQAEKDAADYRLDGAEIEECGIEMPGDL
jgi:hypothetical protein